ncbi:ATP-binding protein [Streptosporangium sp. NBC_01495]|uniref:ATP-binding protein n=1 Tax=Streptosporangium sp. NBC_01495 TaxID=2903899 RepID=UPI003FCC58BC
MPGVLRASPNKGCRSRTPDRPPRWPLRRRRSDHPYTDDVLLLVTELVTNAIRHSDSGQCPDDRVIVAVTSHLGTLHIDVVDAGSTGQRPRLCAGVGSESGGGRGLWLVQELSSAWGWYETLAGRVVWFQLSGQ